MNPKPSFFQKSGIALLITGNLIGAGILALPINTGLAGLVPALFIMILFGLLMFFSAVILSKESIREQRAFFNYPSLYHHYLGFFGKWIAIIANLIILYGLLVAYLTGATAIITNLFHFPFPRVFVLLGFFAIITYLNIADLKVVQKYNAVLMFLLWASFAVIVVLAGKHIDVSRFKYSDWSYLPATVPIVITAFHFHNLIPTVCENLSWDYKSIWKVMFIGIVIGYIMNATWVFVGVGALPLAGSENSLINAFQNNLPATVPLSKIISSPIFLIGSLLFALLAIATSYLANGKALLDFVKDMTTNHFKIKSNKFDVMLTFGPPLIISIVYPNIFLSALNIVGGVGIVLLFGVLPALIAIKNKSSKTLKIIGIIMFIFFIIALGFEIMQETGYFHLNPDVEYWTSIHRLVKQ